MAGQHTHDLVRALADLRVAINALPAGAAKDAVRAAERRVIALVAQTGRHPLRDGVELVPEA